MKSLVGVLIMALLISYAAVVGSKTAREMDDLSGPVKAMAVEKAQLSRQFGKFLGRFSATWAEGPHVRTYSRNYDAKGNKTEETTYKADWTLDKKSAFTYEFDAQGNWTKMTEHTKFETEDDAYWAESIYRTITYY